jgi:sulfate permease, SulP family
MILTPWVHWQHKINRASLAKDSAAALTGALIVLPQAMAYALIAGLPPQFGLYCAMAPAILAALFGSSWHLVSGPTATISIVVFSALTPMAQVGSAEYILLALTLTFLVGLIQLLIAFARVGKLADNIPHSVIVGFTSGAAFLIAASQLKHFFGLPSPIDHSFFNTITNAVTNLHLAKGHVVAVGAITLVVTIAAKRWLKPLPHMVVGMLAGSLLAWGLQNPSVALVGALPSALPQLSSPSFDPQVWLQLAKASIVVALLALTEAIAIAKAVALRSGQTIEGNQETFGQGLSNVAGAFFSAYPSSGSFTRSGVNYEAGAQTPLAAVFAALMLIAILLLVAPLVSYLPIATMAAILLVVAWGLIDKKEIRECFKNKFDSILFLLTFVLCLVSNIEIAVFAGLVMSVLFSLLKKAMSTHKK